MVKDNPQPHNYLGFLMKSAQSFHIVMLLAAGLNLTPAWGSAALSNESDAMQITTHFNNLSGIACDNTAQSCVAVGSKHHRHMLDHITYTTNNGGITWSQGTVLTRPAQVNTVADPIESNQNYMTIRCDTAGKDCIIAGSTSIANQAAILTYTSHDGGCSWSKPNLLFFPEQYKDLIVAEDYPSLRLKCSADANWCILATNTVANNQHIPAFFTTQNTGDTWSPATLINAPESKTLNTPPGLEILDLGCDKSGLFCTAVTQTVETENPDPNVLKAYIPFTPTSLIYSTHDGGMTWSDAKPFKQTQGDSQEPVESKYDVPRLLSCDQSGLSCIALGTRYRIESDEHSTTISGNTHAYHTQNGGLNWQHTTELFPSTPQNTIFFTALDCDISNRFCAAVGFSFDEQDETDIAVPMIYTTIDSGQTWQKKPFTPPDDKRSIILDLFCSEDAALCHTVGLLIKSTS